MAYIDVGYSLQWCTRKLVVREANTIASKSQQLKVTNIALVIKSEIEKIREQIQNIE